jgi:starvation-inducible DNA-binding protein
MSTTITSSTPTSSAVIETLHRNQANAMVLYLNIKKYHWGTFGPLFRDIHLFLDEYATLAIDQVDEFAERAYMLDAKSLGDPADYLPHSTIVASKGEHTLRGMIEELVGNADTIISELHKDAETAAQAGDIGTADLYTRLVQDHQKKRWFAKEMLRKGDGLAN